MKNAAKLVKNFQFSKPEVILRGIPKNAEVSAFGDKYKSFLTTVPNINNNEEINNHLTFRYSSFNSFPKETLTKVIEDSFEIIKSKVHAGKRTSLYNTKMINYIVNEIDFDVNVLLREMNDGGIPFNIGTYGILIEIYSKCGQMEAVEKIIKTMNSEGLEIDTRHKMNLITGYIVAGQPDKAEAIIKDNQLDENDKYVLIHKGRGYSILGQSNKVIDVINKMKENNLEIVPCIYNFYRLLAISNAPESELEQIFQLIPEDNPAVRITTLIFYLNRNGHFNKSLKFAEKHHNLLLDRNTVFDLLTSFNSKLCPKNIYKSVLQLFSEHLDLSHRNLFANLNYDEALSLSQILINDKNGNVILTSLLNKAISDKSVHSIKESLHFGVDNVRINRLNLQLQFGFIPAMLQSGMVSNCEELLKLLPEFHYKLLPPVLMYHLCKGNFSEYDHLTSFWNGKMQLYFSTYFSTLSMEIIRNVSFDEIEKIASEASKIFVPFVINDILSNVIVDLFINKSETNDDNCLPKAVKLAEKFSVNFSHWQINLLNKNVPHHAELFKNFPVRTERAKKYETSNKESEIV